MKSRRRSASSLASSCGFALAGSLLATVAAAQSDDTAASGDPPAGGPGERSGGRDPDPQRAPGGGQGAQRSRPGRRSARAACSATATRSRRTAPSAAATPPSRARTRSRATRKTPSTSAPGGGGGGGRPRRATNGPMFFGRHAEPRRRDALLARRPARRHALGHLRLRTSRTRTSGRASGRTTRRSRTRTGSTRATRSACARGGRRQQRRQRRAIGHGAGGKSLPSTRAATGCRSSTAAGRSRTARCSCATRAGSTTRPTRCGATITGSAKDKMFLSDLDEVYLHIAARATTCSVGQELTVFRPSDDGGRGHDRPDPRHGPHRPVGRRRTTWRARASSSRSTSSSAARAWARSTRKFEVVAPRRNEADVQAHVLASLHPNEFFGQNQVVFIDKGDGRGAQAGQPAVRRAARRRVAAEPRHAARPATACRPTTRRPMPPLEQTPGRKSPRGRNTPTRWSPSCASIDVKKDTRRVPRAAGAPARSSWATWRWRARATSGKRGSLPVRRPSFAVVSLGSLVAAAVRLVAFGRDRGPLRPAERDEDADARRPPAASTTHSTTATRAPATRRAKTATTTRPTTIRARRAGGAEGDDYLAHADAGRHRPRGGCPRNMVRAGELLHRPLRGAEPAGRAGRS